MTGDVNSVAPPIAIIGMACRFPGADSPSKFWDNLVGGVESIERGPDDGQYVRAIGKVIGIEDFDAEYFRTSPIEAAAMDPQSRVLLELSAAALEDAGWLGRDDYVVGVFAGSGENAYYREHVAPNTGICDSLGELRLALANEKDFLAPRIAFKLGLCGPSLTVQASCSTGLTAVAMACQAIAAGDCDIALAGAASFHLPDVDGYVYSDGGINSADGRCRTFDNRASGTVPASGAGVVVLKRDDLATADRDRRYGIIRGWATNNDGGSRAGFTVPNVEGQEAVVRRAMRRAGVHPRDVSYIEAHGTATPLGDPIEIEALSRVFAADDRGAASCAIGSVKTNIGHTDAAAGIAGLIKATLAVRHRRIPASLHFTEPNPAIDFSSTTLYVNSGLLTWPKQDLERIAAISSFGLGGTNSHVIVASSTEPEVDIVRRERQVVVLSARNDVDLARAKARLADWLEPAAPVSPENLADVAYTLAVARPPHTTRWAGAYGSTDELLAALRSPHAAMGHSNRVSVVVRGRPAELTAMVRREALAEPLVRAVLDEYANSLGHVDGITALSALPDDAAGALAVLVSVNALTRLGVSIARVTVPMWASSVIDWSLADGAAEELEELKDRLYCATDTFATESAPLAPDCLVIGPEHHLAVGVAHAWAHGNDIDWRRYYGSEARQRVSLPTYPFARQRHWLEKPASGKSAESTRRARGSSPVDVAHVVETAWIEVLGLKTVDRDADFFDLGGDSITAVEIGARVNEELGQSVPLDLPFQTRTIASMTEFVENHHPKGADV
ncbi:beta-ketoacyl synthase N-terminal-like domain-containing protein [Streptomyces sp. NPDC002920]